MATDFKQTDPRWANHPYAGENMAAAGCGPTSVADLLDISPVEVANWMQANGYASNGSGSYWSAIPAALQHWGHKSEQLSYNSLAGYTSHSSFNTWKNSIQSGNMGILLMHPGTTLSGLTNYWTRGGHFIACVGYRASDGAYLIYDPAWEARCGWHSWNDLAGMIGICYTSDVKWGKGTATTPAAPSTPVSSANTDKAVYSFDVKQLVPGDQGIQVLLLQEILKARGIYTGSLDRSYGNKTKEAVKKYQTLRNLKVDGICGPATWGDLLGL